MGSVERLHQHIVETCLALLHHATLPLRYCSSAFQSATYLIDKLPTQVSNFTSFFTKLFNTTLNYEKLKVNGCLCFLYLRPYNSHKLEPHSRPRVFLDYSSKHNSYRCLDLSFSKIYISRQVIFV